MGLIVCGCSIPLAPGRCGCNYESAIAESVLRIELTSTSCEIALRWNFDDKYILIQVMVWCHQATSHYLSQYWPSSMSSYVITRPKWIDTLGPKLNGRYFAEKNLKCIFFSWKLLNLKVICCLEFNWQIVVIGSGNGLMPSSNQYVWIFMKTKGLVQYKDAILLVLEIPLWR